jgi:uncharacterized membrane protein YhaH (DUF805 family)
MRIPSLPNPFRYLWIAGRSSRLEWWLVHFVCMAGFSLNTDLFTLSTFEAGILGTVRVMHPAARYIVYLLAWISVASIVRRLHDRNKSGWWALLYAVPVIGWGWCFIECGFLPGARIRPNRRRRRAWWSASSRCPGRRGASRRRR